MTTSKVPTPAIPITDRVSKIESQSAGMQVVLDKMLATFKANDLLARVVVLEAELAALKAELS
jgi:hypothetical protein